MHKHLVVEENGIYAFEEVDWHHPIKEAITDTWWTSQYAAEMPEEVVILESASKMSKRKFWHRHPIWLDRT
jgi:hypothetical protein